MGKVPKTLSGRIRSLRGVLTQKEFATQLNELNLDKRVPQHSIQQSMLSRYERGAEIPSPWVLYRLAQSGNTTVEWILMGEKP